MPQWQGGNDPGYHFGSRLLSFLAPKPHGPVETVPVPAPKPGEVLPTENGIVARNALLEQARAAREAIELHKPDCLVTLGGDCLIDLAPMAYLNERYGGKLGVLWIDAHADVTDPKDYPNGHAHVLALLLGQGDAEFVAEVKTPIDPKRVIYAGLNGFMPHEAGMAEALKLAHVGSAALADSSKPITDWIAQQGIAHIAVHFDLDVLDPAKFRALNFNKPGLPADAHPGVPRGRMMPHQVVRLLKEVSAVSDIVGLAIAEHLPWDMIAMRDMLAELPLLAE